MDQEKELKKNYRLALKIVSNIIKSKGITSISPADVVNTAYLKLASNGKSISFLPNKSKYVIVDIIRSECGRTGSKRSKVKKVRVKDFNAFKAKETFEENLSEEDIEFLKSEYKMSERETEILTLRSSGLTLKEIGVKIGVCETRVCQLTTKLAERVRKNSGLNI